MSLVCTCGATLPSDARFCHKCGKPQFVPTPAELESEMHGAGAAEASRAGMVFSVAKGPLNFRDPVAVRVGLSMASLAAMLSWVPFINLGFLIWWLAAGFFAVYLYTRRTGQTLSFRNGLRMGWITGVLTFAITTVLFTISMISLAMSGGGLGDAAVQSHNDLGRCLHGHFDVAVDPGDSQRWSGHHGIGEAFGRRPEEPGKVSSTRTG